MLAVRETGRKALLLHRIPNPSVCHPNGLDSLPGLHGLSGVSSVLLSGKVAALPSDYPPLLAFRSQAQDPVELSLLEPKYAASD